MRREIEIQKKSLERRREPKRRRFFFFFSFHTSHGIKHEASSQHTNIQTNM